MTLSVTTLSNGLKALAPTTSEAAAITALTNAWGIYFQSASVNGTPCGSGTLDGALTAFRLALAGLNTPNLGAEKLAGAVAQFWGSGVVPGAAAIWSGVVSSVTAPTGLSGLQGALEDAFLQNVTEEATLEVAAERVAGVLHDNGGLGGIAVTLPVPPGETVAVL